MSSSISHDDDVMGSSKGSNKPIRVAFQGEKGAYSEAAIYEYLCNNNTYNRIDKDNIEAIGYESFDDVFKAVSKTSLQDGGTDLGMIPIENTLGGTIHANYDLLLRYSGLVFILGEIDFPVKHCLLTRRKIDNPSKVDRAYSHPQALAQCALYLRQHNIKSIIYGDTAGAAKMLSSISINDDDEEEGISAAISSRLAADIYNLHVVDTDIQDIAFNHTRFLLLGHTPSPFVNMDNTTIPTKVSIVFRVQDTPGSMYTSLSAFSHRNLQLTKLESRPVPPAMLDDTTNLETSLLDDYEDDDHNKAYQHHHHHPSTTTSAYYHYLCYIDVLKMPGQDRAVNRAIHTLKEFNHFVRVLSVYPSSTTTTRTTHEYPSPPSSSTLPSLFQPSITTRKISTTRSVSFIGYGKFAQFLCDRLTRVCGDTTTFSATNRKDGDDRWRSDHAKTLGIRYYPDMNIKAMLHHEQPDIIVIATSILSLKDVIHELSSAIKSTTTTTRRRSKKNLLIVDVCSVKEYPKELLKEAFFQNDDDDDTSYITTSLSVSILCTHPMFGPDSGKYGWYNLPLVYDDSMVLLETSLSDHDDYDSKWWLGLFEKCGCRLVKMTSSDHDKIAAATQFITHLTGRVLGGITPKLHTTNIDTLGFRSLIKLMNNTINDSDVLFKGLYRYNTASEQQLLAFQSSFHKVKDMLLLEDDKDDEEEDDDNNVDDITLKTIPYSNLCDRVPSSTTVRLHAQATELKREGRDIQGALGVGEPDFKPPIEITSAIASSLTSGEGCRYSPSNGIFNLRKAIADDLRIRKGIEGIEPKNVVITASGKAAIAASFMAILNAGDEIIIPTPCWPTFPDLARMCDATPVYVQSISPQYAITAHSIASAITSKTKIIVLNSPCNPTGYVIPKDELVRIAELLQQHTGIMAVCDDLYERLVYDGDIHYTLAGVCSPIVRDRIITIGGFSKAFAMTGLRLGYAVCSDDRWIDRAIGKILGQVTGCPCTASQIGGVAALCDVSSSWHKDRLAELQYKRDTLFDRLRMIPNVICPDKPPKGAFYAMPDLGYYVNKLRHSKGDPTLGVAQLCEHLLSSHGLSIVPGDGFCTTQPVVRLSYATSIENIHDACNRLQDFLLVLEAS